MVSKPKPTISIFTISEGHLSLAQAAKETLQDDYQVDIFYKKAAVSQLYVPLYRFLPSSVKIPFELTKNEPTLQLVKSMFKKQYLPEISQHLQQTKPDIVICTSYVLGQALEALVDQYHFSYLNIASDPRSIHPILLSSQATTNFVFDQQAQKLAVKINPQAKTTVSGWFVQERFQPLPNTTKQKTIRKELQLEPDIPTYLLTSGSEGANTVIGILPSLMLINQPLQLIISCGNNRYFHKMVSMMANYLQQNNSPVRFIPLEYTKKLNQYMQAADLVIGKAGPNTIFEAIATHTPFMAITHISGQETGNLEIIKDYQLGWVEENPLQAVSLIKKLVQNPTLIAKRQPTVIEMAQHNNQAPLVLKKTVAQQLT